MSGLTPEFPTDRWEGAPDLGVGVDTVRIAGPTSEALLNELRYQRSSRLVDRRTGQIDESALSSSSTLDIGLAKVRVKARRHPAHAIVSIEASLPKMLQGHNRNTLSVSLFRDGLETVLDMVGRELPDIPKIDATWLERLDLTRDFHGVRQPSLALECLSDRPVPHARLNTVYRRSDNAVQTLVRGSTSQYVVRGYVKGVELEERARSSTTPAERALLKAWADVSQGQLRFEVEVKRETLSRRRASKPWDCTPEVLTGLALHYFDLVGWGAPFGGHREHVAQVLETESLTPAERRNLMIYLYSQELGIESRLNRHALDRTRALVRRHHLLSPRGDSPRRHLDFLTGRMVDV